MVNSHSPPRPCPACGIPMYRGVKGDFRLAACGVCAGLWLDVDTAHGVAQQLPADVCRAIQESYSERARRSCPDCQATLKRIHTPTRPGAGTYRDEHQSLVLLGCPDHGQWLDDADIATLSRVTRERRGEPAPAACQALLDASAEATQPTAAAGGAVEKDLDEMLRHFPFRKMPVILGLVLLPLFLIGFALSPEDMLWLGWAALGSVGLLLTSLSVWLLFLRRAALSKDREHVRLGALHTRIPVEQIEEAAAIRYRRSELDGGFQRYLPDGTPIDPNLGDRGRALKVRWRGEDGQLHRRAVGCAKADALACAIDEARRGLRDDAARLRVDPSGEESRLRIADDERDSNALEEQAAEEAEAQRRATR